jgi:hypothetical protein
VRGTGLSDEPIAWTIARLGGEILELNSAINQLKRAGRDSAAAELLLAEKRAELARLRCGSRP